MSPHSSGAGTFQPLQSKSATPAIRNRIGLGERRGLRQAVTERASPMNSDPRIRRLVLRWWELSDSGHNPSVVELCRDCPELCEAVNEQIRALVALDALISVTTTDRAVTPTTRSAVA